MDETHIDEVKQGTGGETSNKKSGSLEKGQFQGVVRGFMVEKELLEKRHGEEIEQLRESFSKEKQRIIFETHQKEQPTSSSMQFDHGSIERTAHVKRMLGGGQITNHSGAMYCDAIQQGGHGNQFRNGYNQSSEDFSAKLGSSSVEQRSQGGLSYSSSNPHQQQHRQSSNVQQRGHQHQLESHGHVNGFVAQSAQDTQFGVSNRGFSQQHQASHFQNGNLTRNVSASSSCHTGNTDVSQQHLDNHFHQLKSTSAAHETVSNRGSHLQSSGGHAYQLGKPDYPSDRPNGILLNERHNGSNDLQRSPSWTPEFYTYNLHPSKETVTGKTSGEKEIYGVGLDLMNGSSMRVNSGSLASQIRPDLDFEDRLEQQREVFQEQLVEEKRQLRRNLQEEFTRKFEVEKRKQEESFQTLKKTNMELEYHKKEFEITIRHERESLEMKFENERLEYERKLRKDLEDNRAKENIKNETEMQQQREKYEGIVEKQKLDIESLTTQLGELNQSLKQEKDLIVTKFECEVKEIEQRLRIQKEKTESELVVKLKSEISLLTSVNKSLREEVDTKEKEKQDLEVLIKEERRRIEMNYENHISEIEIHFETEKQTLVVQYEEKLAIVLQSEKRALEDASKKTSNEVILLKKENETLRKIAESNFEMEQKAHHEREELVQGLIEEKELLRMQLQEAITKKRLSAGREECELLRLNTQKELKEAQESSTKLYNDLQLAQDERNHLAVKVEDLLEEISKLKRKQEDVGISKQERERLLNEVSKLNEEIDKMFEDVHEKGRREVALKEKLSKVEEALGQKESENTGLKLDKMENQSRLNVLERQCDDLKEDLSSLRRRKMELEEANSSITRKKSDSEGKLVVLQATNEGLLQELHKTKQKISQSEEEVTALKLGNRELHHEVRLLKKNRASYQATMKGLNAKSESEGSGSVLTSADDTGDENARQTDFARQTKKKSSLEKQVSKLKRAKARYENSIERLKEDIGDLEREALKQIEHNKALSAGFVSTKKDFEKQMEALKLSRKILDESIHETELKERVVNEKLSLLGKQKKELQCAVDDLQEEEQRMKEANEREIHHVSKTLDLKTEHAQRQIALLESNKKELKDEIVRMECDGATLRCSIEELQKESEILSQRISQMNESVRDLGRKRVSWMEDKETNERNASLGLNEVKEEVMKLRRERDDLIRSVNELERKQTNLEINAGAVDGSRQVCEKELTVLMQKKKDLESGVFSLKTEKFELETKVNELSATSLEHSTSAQRKEIEMLRSELEITRENCEHIRAMYHGVQNEGKSKVEVVEAELKMAEDSFLSLKRERLELEKIISTLLRQKTELEAEVAMVVDAKYREDRDTNTLREERLDLDAELLRLKSHVSGLRSLVSTLDDEKSRAERELGSLETRKERVDRYVSAMEARLLVGQSSPISWNFNQSNDYALTPKDDLEKQVLELREHKLSLEADLFRLRRKSGDGIDTRSRTYGGEISLGDRHVSFGHLGATADYGGFENENLHRDIEGLNQQKSKLSNEVTEMKLRKTDLDVQITNLEYRKLGLEESGRLVQRGKKEGCDDVSGFASETKITPTEEYSNKMDFADYSVEQMQDLRKKNTSLEEKLSALERRLHEAKYDMEMQTLECQKELNLVQDTLKSHQRDPRQQHQLNLVVDRLKTFVEKSESSNEDKLYEEIKDEIKGLNEKVDTNSRQMREIHKSSLAFGQRESHSTQSMSATKDIYEICEHINDAEVGMERYSNVVSHLQKENIDLLEVVSKLEERLSAAGKSQEKLQRKKAILQQLLEKVGENTGEDFIQQSNLIFELDKDLPV